MKELINRITAQLDSMDLPDKYQTALYNYGVQKLINITHEEAKSLYDFISKDKVEMKDTTRVKKGIFETTGSNDFRYFFHAEYTITLDRQRTWEKLSVSKSNSEKFVGSIELYYNGDTAPPITNDVQALAKIILSNLNKNEPEDDPEKIWTLGETRKSIAEKCHKLITKQAYDDKEYNESAKGSVAVVGDDGTEYLFTAYDFAKWGGSEANYSGELTIECVKTGFVRTIYSYNYYMR